MSRIQHPDDLTAQIREALNRDEDILFAYLYGSAVYDPNLPGGDIDIAVYLRPSNMKSYVRKDKELTGLLVSQLHTDAIDLRIVNVLPLVFQYGILKDATLLFSRDEEQRADFETGVMTRYFELKPYLDEYREMLSLKIRGAK